MHLFISSKTLGKKGTNNFKKSAKTFLKNKKFKINKVNLFGDKFISYYIK